jgi:hypothetical protein
VVRVHQKARQAAAYYSAVVILRIEKKNARRT